MTVIEELAHHVRNLTPAQQARVLAFVRSLDSSRAPMPPGAELAALLTFAGRIPEGDLKQIEKAIEDDCEQVDPHGW